MRQNRGVIHKNSTELSLCSWAEGKLLWRENQNPKGFSGLTFQKSARQTASELLSYPLSFRWPTLCPVVLSLVPYSSVPGKQTCGYDCCQSLGFPKWQESWWDGMYRRGEDSSVGACQKSQLQTLKNHLEDKVPNPAFSQLVVLAGEGPPEGSGVWPSGDKHRARLSYSLQAGAWSKSRCCCRVMVGWADNMIQSSGEGKGFFLPLCSVWNHSQRS